MRNRIKAIIVFITLLIAQANAKEIVINFGIDSETGKNEFNAETGTYNEITLISQGVKFTATKGSSTSTVNLNDSRLRVPIKGTFNISTTDGTLIKGVYFTNTTVNSFSIPMGTLIYPQWTGEELSIDLTITNVTSFYSLTITTVGASAPDNPITSVESGTYNEEQSVSISSPTEGAEIYYTIDGTDPSESSAATLYSAPIKIDRITTLKAVAKGSDGTYSEVITKEYTLKQNPVTEIKNENIIKKKFIKSAYISFSKEDPNAIIKYKTAESTNYQNFNNYVYINKTTHFDVIATREGWEDSDVSSFDYTMIQIDTDYNLDFPVSADNGSLINVVIQKDFFSATFEKGTSESDPIYKSEYYKYSYVLYRGNTMTLSYPGLKITKLDLIVNDISNHNDILVNGSSNGVGSSDITYTWEGRSFDKLVIENMTNKAFEIKEIKIYYRSGKAEVRDNLGDIFTTKQDGVEYTLDLDLCGFAAEGNILYAATKNGYCSNLQENPNPGADIYEDNPIKFAQRDWIALEVDEPLNYVNKSIDPGLVGIYDSSDSIHKLKVTKISTEYDFYPDLYLNQYFVRNFLGAKKNPTDHKIFFMIPNLCEYATFVGNIIVEDDKYYLSSEDGKIRIDNSLINLTPTEGSTFKKIDGYIKIVPIEAGTEPTANNYRLEIPTGYDILIVATADKGIATSVEKLESNDNISITTLEGAITVSANIETPCTIYTPTGTLYRQTTINATPTTIPLPTGIYILSTPTTTHKLIVK